jgi:hypothetical protein
MRRIFAYKVLQLKDDRLCSYVGDTSLSVTYRREIWNRPKIGKLFVFKNLSFAQNFLREHGCDTYYRIYKVQVDSLIKTPQLIPGIYSPMKIRFWSLFKKGKNADNFQNTIYAPEGTMFCNRLKLVKRMVYSQ